MAFERNPIMLGDNGIPVRYYPYHISMKGEDNENYGNTRNACLVVWLR